MVACLEAACLGGVDGGLEDGDPLSAVVAALAVFEQDGFTNCGVGSNLNEEGLCETDGGVMSCLGGPGAVAAVPGIAEAAALARRLADAHLPGHGRGPGDLVPPRVLCGHGAVEFARSIGIHATRLQTDAKLQTFTRIERGLKRKRGDHDTVGAVALFGGRVACGTSSGGFWVKRVGRVGSSAIPGAGFWCDARGGVEVAVVASGAGEDITSRCLALRAADAILDHRDTDLLMGIQAGLIALTTDGRVTITHSAETEMGWAIATSKHPKPRIYIS